MLGVRHGADGAGPARAAGYADHLLERTVDADQLTLAAAYSGDEQAASRAIDAGQGSLAIARPDMAPDVAAALGFSPGQPLDRDDLVNLLSGKRADGGDLALRGAAERETAWVDFTFSAHKSVSVAWFAAATGAERASIAAAHRQAVSSTMAHIEAEAARAGRGSGEEERCRLGWFSVEHFTSRPTLAMKTGGGGTELVTLPASAGDPELHTHVVAPTAMVGADSGRLLTFDTGRLNGRRKEFGAVYQAFLAANLRSLGMDVALCPKGIAARLSAIPDSVCDLFSQRTRKAETAARAWAAKEGLDWDRMPDRQRVAAVKAGAKRGRAGTGDDLADFAAWRATAEHHRWFYGGTAVTYGPPAPEPSPEDRARLARDAAAPLLADKLEKNAQVTGADLREMAARGWVAAGGIADPAAVSAVTRLFVKEGVTQSGETTGLLWLSDGERRPERVRVTTALHRDQELDLIRLAKKMGGDKRWSLSPRQIKAAVRRSGFDFSDAHGKAQLGMVRHAGTGGALTVGLAAAGVGKTTRILPVLVDEWHRQGHAVWGAALAWRQASEPLDEAGIRRDRIWAVDPFLKRVASGEAALRPGDKIVVDEVSLLGTRQLLEILRAADKAGAQVFLTGDRQQAQGVEAGPIFDLLERGLGKGSMPEIDTTVRQRSDEEKRIAGLFRQGEVKEAIDAKRKDGTALMVPGGYDDAVARVATLWKERADANKADPAYTVTVSAPTNKDALEIGRAIRGVRLAAGEIDGTREGTVNVRATDRAGNGYVLTLAAGDRVRLFKRTRAAFTTKDGHTKWALAGDNGSILAVVRVDKRPGEGGLVLRTPKGKEGFVPWDGLRDKATGRVALTYGDCLTVNTAQGITSDEHIWAMPGGSQALDRFRAYVGASRHRLRSWMVASEGAELAQVEGRRPRGAEPLAGAEAREAAWANAVKNLSRVPIKESAIDLLRASQRRKREAQEVRLEGQRRRERRQAQGRSPTVALARARHQGDMERAQAVLEGLERTAAAVARTVEQAARSKPDQIPPSQKNARDQSVAAARPTAPPRNRPPAQIPGKSFVRRSALSETEAQARFRDAAAAYGLRIPGLPIMDGQKHTVPVEGDRGRQRSGFYRAHYHGGVPNGWFGKKGDPPGRWIADAETVRISPEEAAAIQAKQAADKAAKEEALAARREGAAQQAVWTLEGARPATASNAYLKAKGIADVPAGLREDLRGNLLVPLKDVGGRVRNVQTIAPDGAKLYMAGAQKNGVGFMVGAPREGEPVGVAEGLATAWSAHKASGLAVAVALDTSNLSHVAKAVRTAEPNRALVFFADNDAHLPRREGVKSGPNVGLDKAAAAAVSVGNATMALAPELPDRTARDKGTDWNDFHAAKGLESARAAMRLHGVPMRGDQAAKAVALENPPKPPERDRGNRLQR